MPLIKTDVKRTIKNHLGSFLNKFGYRFDRKTDGFLREFNGGFNEVGFSIVDYRPKFELSFFFLVRLDVVEKIVQKFSFVIEEYRDFTWTINTGIDHFTGIRNYMVSEETELIQVLQDIELVYASKIDAFLKQYSDISNLDRALNSEHIKIGHLMSPEDYIRPIIIAKLTKNQDFEKVADLHYNDYRKEYFLDLEEGPRKIREAIDYLKAQ